jgi:hypothetical protein
MQNAIVEGRVMYLNIPTPFTVKGDVGPCCELPHDGACGIVAVSLRRFGSSGGGAVVAVEAKGAGGSLHGRLGSLMRGIHGGPKYT